MSRLRTIVEAHNTRVDPDERARRKAKRTATNRAEWFAAQIASTSDPLDLLSIACRYAQAVGKSMAPADAAQVRELAKAIAGAADERNQRWLQ
jgi:hypothetical protein